MESLIVIVITVFIAFNILLISDFVDRYDYDIRRPLKDFKDQNVAVFIVSMFVLPAILIYFILSLLIKFLTWKPFE